MIFNSIKWRLQVWHSLILVVVLAAFGLSAYHVAREGQLRRIDHDLDAELMALLRPERLGGEPGRMEPRPGLPDARPNLPRPEPREFFGQRPDPLLRVRRAIEAMPSPEEGQTDEIYFVAWHQDGTVAARSAGAPEVADPVQNPSAPAGELHSLGGPDPPPPLRPGPPQPPVARTRGPYREVYRVLPGGACLLAGRSLAADLATMRRLAAWLVIAGAGVLVVGLAGGWWLATRAIRPIEDISNTAQKIAAGDLSQRISAAHTDNELGRLAGVLNSTFARLESAFAHQARFTSDASHELRTPISVILMQTENALSRPRPEEEYRSTLAACQRAARRMRTLAESLLQLARLDAGQEPMQRKEFDLARVTQESLELLKPLAQEKGVEILTDFQPAECLGDPERIGQVATNLLSNAIYFNRKAGQVRVSTRLQDGSALLTVADDGQGIPAEDLPHIFERFYRGDKARSGVQGRTGLGLAISKAIVDAHSGTIAAESQPGAGATFTVTLPLASPVVPQSP